MADLKYPLKSNTVPFWVVPIVVILLPVPVFIIYYFYQKDVYDLHGALLGTSLKNLRPQLDSFCFQNVMGMSVVLCHRKPGILFSVVITSVITDAIKDAIGRPRPNFFWRCFPDGNKVFHNVTSSVVCDGNKVVIKEGHKSFPSGHTSWSFAGLGFLSWYLAGKLGAFDRRGHVAKLCIVFLPLLVAALVAVSRVDDDWHHWQDVFARGLLGIAVASFCYLQFFPAPNDIDVGGICWGNNSEFHQQFSSGIKTVAVISVAPQVVVQFGSTQKIMESLDFVNHVRSSFVSLQSSDGLLSRIAPTSLRSGIFDSSGIVASVVCSVNSSSNYGNNKSMQDGRNKELAIHPESSPLNLGL